MIAPARDEEEIRRERQSFILLQHLYTLTDADPAVAASTHRAALDLGFPPVEIAALVRHLSEAGYLVRARGDTARCIPTAGAAYIERLARRRRSVRISSRGSRDARPRVAGRSA